MARLEPAGWHEPGDHAAMVILGLDAAMACCSAAVSADGVVLAEIAEAGGRGYATALPGMVRDVLARSGVTASALDGVAVTVGPGSFTGLRAALALAHGIAVATGRPAVGVTVAEALADAVRDGDPRPGAGYELWVAIDSRRGRIFLDRLAAGTPAAATGLDTLPLPSGPLLVAGDAAAEVVARLTARGAAASCSDVALPHARHVAAVGARRLAGLLAPLPAGPLYIDPPEAKLPAGGLRPSPQG